MEFNLDWPATGEAGKSYKSKVQSGFWERYVKGPNVLDIGFKGDIPNAVPVLECATGVDSDFPGYNGKRLPFPDGSQDVVYSSHCLEHIRDYVHVIQDWYRVIKVGGHIITVVPSGALYERRRRVPSRWNPDHARVYTPSSLLAEFEAALLPNSYRVRHLAENDWIYRYEDPPTVHPYGCYEIELVIEKINPPVWKLED